MEDASIQCAWYIFMKHACFAKAQYQRWLVCLRSDIEFTNTCSFTIKFKISRMHALRCLSECMICVGEPEAVSSLSFIESTPLAPETSHNTKKRKRVCIEGFEHADMLSSQSPRCSSDTNFHNVEKFGLTFTYFPSTLLTHCH